jgi:serine/threonine-protein kinase
MHESRVGPGATTEPDRDSRASLEAGAVLGGKYRLVEPLGRGGMGTVWRAHHLSLDAPVAVKLLDPAWTDRPRTRARFQREAIAAARLRSPHVVQVLDHGVEAGTPYIVMELLEGVDLAQRLRAHGPLGVAEAARIVVAVCKGLERAHDAGIVHRDIKPSNVFLCSDGGAGGGSVKLLDFGIARAHHLGAGGELTASGVILGTPRYMSPEQMLGDEVDARSDLWSAALVGYSALTGKMPFDSTDVNVLVLAHMKAAATLPRELPPETPASLRAFFTRALAFKPVERFPTARELAQAFAKAALGDDADVSWGAGPPAPARSATPSEPASDASTMETAQATASDTARSGAATPADASSAATQPLRKRRRAGRPSPALWIAAGAALLGVAIAVGILFRGPRRLAASTAPAASLPTETAAPPAGVSATVLDDAAPDPEGDDAAYPGPAASPPSGAPPRPGRSTTRGAKPATPYERNPSLGY